MHHPVPIDRPLPPLPRTAIELHVLPVQICNQFRRTPPLVLSTPPVGNPLPGPVICGGSTNPPTLPAFQTMQLTTTHSKVWDKSLRPRFPRMGVSVQTGTSYWDKQQMNDGNLLRKRTIVDAVDAQNVGLNLGRNNGCERLFARTSTASDRTSKSGIRKWINRYSNIKTRLTPITERLGGSSYSVRRFSERVRRPSSSSSSVTNYSDETDTTNLSFTWPLSKSQNNLSHWMFKSVSGSGEENNEINAGSLTGRQHEVAKGTMDSNPRTADIDQWARMVTDSEDMLKRLKHMRIISLTAKRWKVKRRPDGTRYLVHHRSRENGKRYSKPMASSIQQNESKLTNQKEVTDEEEVRTMPVFKSRQTTYLPSPTKPFDLPSQIPPNDNEIEVPNTNSNNFEEFNNQLTKKKHISSSKLNFRKSGTASSSGNEHTKLAISKLPSHKHLADASIFSRISQKYNFPTCSARGSLRSSDGGSTTGSTKLVTMLVV